MNLRIISRLFTLTMILLVVLSCEYKDYPDPIWNAADPGEATPTITAVDPPSLVYNGLTVVTITGSNFSEVASENMVTFNGQIAEIDADQSSTTQLVVTTPIVILDATVNVVEDVKLLVAVQGAYAGALYDQPFRVERAVVEVGGFIGEQPEKNPNNICSDAAENLYVTGTDKILYKIDSSGTRTAFGTGLAATTHDLKAGPAGRIYFVRNNPYLYRFEPTGGAAVRWLRVKSKLTCFDFNQAQNIYCGGKNDSLYYVDIIAESILGVALADDYRYVSLKVYDGYVYVAGEYIGSDTTVDVVEGIWRHQINADNFLAPRELVYDWSNYAYAAEQHLSSMVINEEGLFYIGVTEGSGPAVIILDPATANTEPFYNAVLFAPASKLEWGPNKNIYLARYSDAPAEATPNGVFRVAQDYAGAPYYGRD